MADPARKLPSFEDLYAEIERLPQGITGEILDTGVLRTITGWWLPRSPPADRHAS